MKIKLQLFGTFRKHKSEVDITLPEGSMVKDLRPQLLDILKDKNLGINIKSLIDSSRFANNESILNEESVINKNDNLSILPPVSGG